MRGDDGGEEEARWPGDEDGDENVDDNDGRWCSKGIKAGRMVREDGCGDAEGPENSCGTVDDDLAVKCVPGGWNAERKRAQQPVAPTP